MYGDPLEHPQTESYWGNVNCIGERSCYDEGKRAAECLTFDYQREHGMEVHSFSPVFAAPSKQGRGSGGEGKGEAFLFYRGTLSFS